MSYIIYNNFELSKLGILNFKTLTGWPGQYFVWIEGFWATHNIYIWLLLFQKDKLLGKIFIVFIIIVSLRGRQRAVMDAFGQFFLVMLVGVATPTKYKHRIVAVVGLHSLLPINVGTCG
jgi:hypothetical protein